MSTNQVKLLGLSKLKREFTGLNWKSTKIKQQMRLAMKKGARPNSKNVKAAIRGTTRFSRSAASRFARTYGFNNVGHKQGQSFGIVLSPRLAGGNPPRKSKNPIHTNDPRPNRKDMRYMINFHAKYINMPNPDTYGVIKAQGDYIEHLWKKGRLK